MLCDKKSTIPNIAIFDIMNFFKLLKIIAAPIGCGVFETIEISEMIEIMEMIDTVKVADD